MITNIYLTRHGQTEWNLESRIQGWLNSPLTKEGIEQAKKLGHRIKNLPLHAIYSSTSQRAYATATYVRGDREIEIVQTEQLMEMHFGQWEGRQTSEIEEQFPEEVNLIRENPAKYKAEISKGETYWDVQKRMVSFVNHTLEKHRGENVLLVSHGTAIRTLINYYLGQGIERLWEVPKIEWTTLYQLTFAQEKVRVSCEQPEYIDPSLR